MEQYEYLIIGGGMAADAAARGIRELDMSGRIGLISDEKHPPYDRPPLTKGLWFGKEVENIWRHTDLENIAVHLGRRATHINPETHIVTDDVGNTYWYKKLFLATGGSPKKLGCPDEGVLYYRTLEDYYNLRLLYDQGEEFIVIGSGYIGTEIAAALAMNGKKVTLIFRESSIQSYRFPKGFSLFLNSYFTEKGVTLVPEQTVAKVTQEAERFHVTTESGDRFSADGVIAGIGISPNLQLAEELGLDRDNGILVNRNLQCSHPDIYSAGDVANFYSPHLEMRVRSEHEDTANTMGRCAGRNMAGANEPYSHLPFFYSDLFELGYEAIGETRSELDVVEDWHDLYRKGALYYLRDGRLRGAVLVGIWNKIDQVRELIASKESFTPDALIGLIQA